MKDYTQYSSRIPSPGVRRSTPGTPKTKATTTKNVANHPLNDGSANVKSFHTPSPDKRERESTTTVSSSSSTQRQQPQHEQNNLKTPDTTGSTRKEDGSSIQKLRQALDEATAQDLTAKAALAKSDAVILELRSTIRELKRQLDDQNSKMSGLQKQIQQLQQQLAISQSSSKDAKVGELQVQLDRAHAQILTADMVRKELEDTLEAEQYTWELRVQDQERSIAQLQQECDTLAQDLETCRGQWKEAEQGWSLQLEDLQQQLTQTRTRMAASQALKQSSNNEEMMKKLSNLEKERSELQSCLDEALQELEAVDAELRTDDSDSKKRRKDPENIEALQHLLRLLLQETNTDSTKSHPRLHNLSQDPKELVSQIQRELEKLLSSTGETPKENSQDMRELESQLSVYQEELKSREKSSAELRDSLKEAVALLKPLQDAVAKAEEEKQVLRDQLGKSENESTQIAQLKDELKQKAKQLQSLQEQTSSLQDQLDEHKKLAAARQSLLEANTSPVATPRANEGDSLSKIRKAREELRKKRETEGNLQQLLKDAQSRFHSLHQQNEDAAARNRELQGKLKNAEQQLGGASHPSIEDRLAHYEQELGKKEKEVRALQEKLENWDDRGSRSDASINHRVQELEFELSNKTTELTQKEQAEKILNKSLKDALGLLKPLQMHLEDAEREKMEISKELRSLRKRFRQLQMGDMTDDQSRSTMGGDSSIELIKMKEGLEETVRQLELENSQLHDALEELSGEDTTRSEAKLRQQIVELNSRYEVTQNKLEDSHVENHALVKALKQKELEERQRSNELRALQETLQKKENELGNAKAIARSALVKVEELTMANVEQLSLSRDGSLDPSMNLANIEAMSG